jgi:uncharacterized membrane protein
MQDQPASEAARRWLGRETASLAATERHVLDHLTRRRTISRNPDAAFEAGAGFGARAADRVAAFGGSWAFIGLFAVLLVLWCGLNLLLGPGAFDPYPFIFLNLVLSMLAAVQAPIIMMSQNRQAEKDRLAAAHDYEVNLKAELEIMALHEKLDRLRAEGIERLLAQQQAQLALIEAALARLSPPERGFSPDGP